MDELHELLEEGRRRARKTCNLRFFEQCKTAYIKRNEYGKVVQLWVSSRPEEHEIDGFRYEDISNNMKIKRFIAKNAMNLIIYDRPPEGAVDIRLDPTLISDLKLIYL